MKLTRRQTLQLLAAAAPAFALRNAFSQTPTGNQGQSPATPPLTITPGPYTNTRASLRAYTQPDWFADAKFGIWAHWGPQSAIGDGDWYARNMYIEGQPQYDYHRKRFGPQSKIGYKDLIHLYTADQWDPDHLIGLYQKAGAKYFFSMGVHHDNYDLWNSKYQPRWNSVASGPRKDVVGLWAAAARKRGLRFGVSEHLSNSFDWFAPSHLADTKGPYANIPYDGQNPAFADLYHSYADMPPNFAHTILPDPMGRTAPTWWKLQYFNRVKDLLDQHQPDLLYTDGGISFDDYGLATVAELYNVGPYSYEHKSEAIYFSKTPTDCPDATSCVIDHERSVLNQIDPNPWQTDTCIGDWHYKPRREIQDPQESHRPPSRHRQQKRQPPAQHPPPRLRPPRPRRAPHPRGDHPVDLDQRGSHLLHTPLEDPRRRPLHQGRHQAQRQRVRPQRRQATRPHLSRHPLHHQRQNPLRPRPGLAYLNTGHRIPRHQQPATTRQTPRRPPPRPRRTPPLHARHHRPPHNPPPNPNPRLRSRRSPPHPLRITSCHNSGCPTSRF